ncbi:MAG: hypothetical protein J0I06_08155 [Planctomycetes bacterium]|nr:hypothetical protein [Planctomycetota bacterium]
MVWAAVENGMTLGTQGSEGGVIERDEEHADGARITIERGGSTAPYSITCGIYGWMCHTRFFGTAQEANQAFEEMKFGLTNILALIPLQSDPEADAKCARVVNTVQDFVARFP